MTGLCDNCDYITDIHFKQKSHPNGIQETYFKCEHCHYRYTSFVTDSKVRKMQRNKDKVIDTAKRLTMQEEINARMSKLKHNLITFGRADL